jgi:hypothetical protein
LCKSLTVRELLADGKIRLAYTTVMTTLDRLFKKGLLNRKRLTNTSVRGRGFLLKFSDERRTNGFSTQTTYTCRSSGVGGRIHELRYAPQRVCRSRGLSFSTPNRHLKKRRWKRRRRPVSSAGRLVKVELAAKKSPTQHDATFGLAVVLPGGRRIEVHPDFDTNTFERLVRALERV